MKRRRTNPAVAAKRAAARFIEVGKAGPHWLLRLSTFQQSENSV
jgi:hypothetical protein